jgi:hypothetical protein
VPSANDSANMPSGTTDHTSPRLCSGRTTQRNGSRALRVAPVVVDIQYLSNVAKVMENTPPRTWRVSLIKKKMEYVGRVQAVDKASAELVAATEFQLKDHERERLFIEEVS